MQNSESQNPQSVFNKTLSDMQTNMADKLNFRVSKTSSKAQERYLGQRKRRQSPEHTHTGTAN